jgi:hypothetical protein
MDQAEEYSLELNKTFNKFEKYMLRVEKITGKHLKCTDQVLMTPLQSLSIFTID